jgi:pyruvate/2-oxoglutarate dehydrogenase complex dihydrolipoamide dehydrogenase (E3) component
MQWNECLRYLTSTGAVGIEMAAELKVIEPSVRVTLVHSRDKLLSSEGLPDDCKDKALELLLESGVEVLMNHRLGGTRKLETEDGSSKIEITFSSPENKTMIASEVIMAVSKSIPTTEYLPTDAVDKEGYIKIHSKYLPTSLRF